MCCMLETCIILNFYGIFVTHPFRQINGNVATKLSRSNCLFGFVEIIMNAKVDRMAVLMQLDENDVTAILYKETVCVISAMGSQIER